jgi:hypothetical protein
MTAKGFDKEGFSQRSPDEFRKEFNKVELVVTSEGEPETGADGLVRKKVRFQVTENGKIDMDTATFVKRGEEWLLESF